MFNSLSLEQKIGQLFFIGIAGGSVDEPTKRLLSDIRPGGICLFSRNIREARQTRYLTDELTSLLPVRPFLSLDQEGGLVDRLRRIVTPVPSASAFVNESDISRFAVIIAETLRILGFNMNFAPVVDVIDERRSRFSNGLHSRAYGHSAEDVNVLAGVFLRTLQENGCIGCIKHFPGLGAAEVDSHEELPLVNISKDELFSSDIVPYRHFFESRDARVLMVAHAAYPVIDLQEMDQDGRLLPASLSYNMVTRLLREELGFVGLTVTDDLEMGAILKHYGIGEACKMAIKAGSDMLAICANADSIYSGFAEVLDAVRSGEIKEDRIDKSLDRILRLKSELSLPLPFDISRIDQLSSEISDLKASLN